MMTSMDSLEIIGNFFLFILGASLLYAVNQSKKMKYETATILIWASQYVFIVGTIGLARMFLILDQKDALNATWIGLILFTLIVVYDVLLKPKLRK